MLKTLFAVAFVISGVPESSAQWMRTTMASNQQIISVAALRNSYFAGTYDSAYQSTDQGLHWSPINFDLQGMGRNRFFVYGDTLYLGSDLNTFTGGILRSTNVGATWRTLGDGLEYGLNSMTESADTLFAGNQVGVYRLNPNASAWTPQNSGLSDTSIRSLTAGDGLIFVGTENSGTFISSDNGNHWDSINSGKMAYENIHPLLYLNGMIFAAGGWDFLQSADLGATWYAGNPQFTKSEMVWAIVAKNDFVFVGNHSGVFLSTDYGTSWKSVSEGLVDTFVLSLAITNTELIAGTQRGTIWRRPLTEMTTGVADGPVQPSSPLEAITCYPNPISTSSIVEYTTHSHSTPVAEVFDVLGERVRAQAMTESSGGNFLGRIDVRGLQSGSYVLRIHDGVTVASKIIGVAK